MVERVEQMTPKGTVKKITISTFHSLCVKILRRDIDKIGYKPNFAIYTGGEQLSLIRRIIVKKASSLARGCSRRAVTSARPVAWRTGTRRT